MRGAATAIALGATLALGCSSSSFAVDAVVPGRVSALGASPVQVRGRGFFAVARAAIDNGKPTTVDGAFALAIGGVTLDGAAVQRLDDHTLFTTVPAGMTPGRYDVVATAPDGRHARAVGALQVLIPPALTATLTATPPTPAAGQDFLVTLNVANQGEAAALAVTASDLGIAGGGAAHVLGAPTAADVAGGGSQSFVFNCHADAPGDIALVASAAGTDSSGVAVAAAPASLALHVDTVPVLQASIAAAPTTVSVGQSFTVTLTVANAGMASASAVAAGDPTISGSGAVTRTSPAPLAADIAGGAQHVYRWTYLATAAGSVSLAVSAAGTDPAGATVATPTLQTPTIVIQPAAMLSATMAATPVKVSTGQTITLTMTVTNGGGATAKSVMPTLPTLSGSGGASVVTVPTASDIPAGTSAPFTWTYAASVAGSVTFGASASGTDANSGAVVSSAPATSNAVVIQTAAALTATVTAAPATVTVNQLFAVDVVVGNAGQADANGVATTLPLLSGPGLATLVISPGAQTVPGGQSRTFTWTFKATGSGTTTLSSHATGTDANSGQSLASATATSNVVTIQTAPSLTASISALPSPVLQGGQVTVTLTITNSGQASVTGLTPSLVIGGSSTVTLVSGPAPPTTTLGGGAQATFTWRYQAGGAGTLGFTGQAAGSDGNSGAAVSSPTAAVTINVVKHAQVTGTFNVPANVAPGAIFTVDMQVTCVLNGNNCNNVTPSALTVTGSSTATLLSGPSPASVASMGDGNTVTFSWTYRAGVAGTLTFSGSASAQDASDNSVVLTGTFSSSVIIVGSPAVLTATLTLPAAINRGANFTVTLLVQDTGAVAANGVAPSLLSASGSGSATVVSGPTPASANIPGGGNVTFTWTYRATTNGTLTLSGSATGTDAGNAQPLTVSFSSGSATIADVTRLFVDPFGDGTPFVDVFGYNGLVYLGPRKSGAGAMRANPDGSAPQNVSFAFPRDSVGHSMSNTSAAPYPSIGASGCTPNTASCGPDNENGRGIFTSGVIAGTPWLVIAGAKSTSTSYIYMTADTSTAPVIPYVDLQTLTSGSPFGATATHIFHDAVYTGFAAGAGPDLIKLVNTPTAPGLNAANNVDAFNLKLDVSPLGGSNSIVDVVADFADRLYVANAQGCLMSTNNAPRAYANNPGDWATCTPSTDPQTIVATAKTSSIEPADRAYPAAVAFGGLLYLARNTQAGPQLFACNPAATGDPALCDPADWTLVARNSQGNLALSQFDEAGNGAITLLVATANHLYVGFNNATGIQLYRSTVAAPQMRADFEGAGGCSAALHPASCAPLGGSGLGNAATNVRIFAATAFSVAAHDYLYLTTGNGAVGGSVYTVVE